MSEEKLYCNCRDGMEITKSEKLMAERTGYSEEFIHKFMDTWMDCASERR